MFRRDYILNSMKCLIEVLDDLVLSYNKDDLGMSPEHACDPVSHPIHIQYPAIPGNGIGTC
jgi:hypothetical protein